MMLRLNLILTFWLIIKPIHPFVDRLSVMSLVSDVFGSCVSYTLLGILRSTTIEPQSAESMYTNDGDVQSFPDQTLRVKRSTTRIETVFV